MKPLSEQLAQLSANAKRAEENFARAHDQVNEDFEHTRRVARETAKEAIDELNREVANVRDVAGSRWQAFRAKLQADADGLKENIEQDRREFSAWQKENYAESCEEDAILAIDYASAAITMAESAVLDAVEARRTALVAQAAATPAAHAVA